eukprot:TRINITY_DN866_c0_g1_i4.p2 TRINITY_DN866_c0_g1~~TRINITY_DN866_c0_g1_i4.p2  ORF type:complete len:60 (+),score=7.49 TRINITY_DN866_c0_g1_i4:487-666(+)
MEMSSVQNTHTMINVIQMDLFKYLKIVHVAPIQFANLLIGVTTTNAMIFLCVKKATPPQ